MIDQKCQTMADKATTDHHHPAKQWSFDELHGALEDCVTKGAAHRRVCKGTDPEHPEYVLYSYKSITTADWRGMPALALARGICVLQHGPLRQFRLRSSSTTTSILLRAGSRLGRSRPLRTSTMGALASHFSTSGSVSGA